MKLNELLGKTLKETLEEMDLVEAGISAEGNEEIELIELRYAKRIGLGRNLVVRNKEDA